jgi:hypothetical protein
MHTTCKPFPKGLREISRNCKKTGFPTRSDYRVLVPLHLE